MNDLGIFAITGSEETLDMLIHTSKLSNENWTLYAEANRPAEMTCWNTVSAPLTFVVVVFTGRVAGLQYRVICVENPMGA